MQGLQCNAIAMKEIIHSRIVCNLFVLLLPSFSVSFSRTINSLMGLYMPQLVTELISSEMKSIEKQEKPSGHSDLG